MPNMNLPKLSVVVLLLMMAAVPADAQRRRRGFGPSTQERTESLQQVEQALVELKATYRDRSDMEPALRAWRELPNDERTELRRRLGQSREAEVAALLAIERHLAALRGVRGIRTEHEEDQRRLGAIRGLAAAGETATVAECLDTMLRQRSEAFHARLVELGIESDLAVPPQRVHTGEAFLPGALWPDASGVHINAHGGGVLHHQDAYYWFGEHKTAGPGGNQANVGVRCYRSTDLLNWTDEGVALAVSDDPASDITQGCVIERPKVIHNQTTGKFVMWFHLELKGQGYNAARTAVAVADSVAGPYTLVRSLRPHAGVWPENFPMALRTSDSEGTVEDGMYVRRDFAGGQMARDMTLFVDDDGKAYHVAASEENYTLHLSELSDDYLSFTDRYVRIFPGGHNEAPALFKHAGKYYLLTSGCTGWAPNAARSAVADSIWGEWRSLGNPCVGVNPEEILGAAKTFGGQSTFVLPAPGRPGAFIAMFDVWRPRNAIDGRYLWLPVEITADGFRVPWRSKWDLSLFDDPGA